MMTMTTGRLRCLPYICWMPLRSSSGNTKFGWMPWYHGNISAPFTELWLRPSECPNSCAATAKSEVPKKIENTMLKRNINEYSSTKPTLFCEKRQFFRSQNVHVIIASVSKSVSIFYSHVVFSWIKLDIYTWLAEYNSKWRCNRPLSV